MHPLYTGLYMGEPLTSKTMPLHATQLKNQKGKKKMLRTRPMKIKNQPPPPAPRKPSPPSAGRSYGWKAGLTEAGKRLQKGGKLTR